jgi:hypothetical protein
MYLDGPCSRVWVDKHSSETFPINNDLEQGETLSPLPYNFALEYNIETI